MKIFCTVLFLLCFFSTFAADSIPTYLQEISVTIRAGNAEGSGIIFTRNDAETNKVNFIWTAAHVVRGLRQQRDVISGDGSKRTIVEFKDALVVKEIIEDGRRVGQLSLAAEVIRYSDADNGHDLALLRLRKKNFISSSARFYMEKEIPTLGTELYHVGSLLGEMGANSMTSGIYSQVGRLINGNYFDQTTVAAFPGSSGGGVFLKDGRYVGMLVRGAGETFNLIVPVRRISEWVKTTKMEWATNPDVSMPSDEELIKMPVEDVGKEFKSLSK